MLRGYSFRPRGWGLALAAAGCAAGILLGQWQSRRADAKLALERKFEASLQQPPVTVPATPVQASELLQKRVAASGAFIGDRTLLLDNRNRGGRPGYEVVTPLWLSPSMAVLVERGWVARGSVEKGGRDAVRTPGGVQRVDGLALARVPKALTPPGAPESGPVRQNVDIEAYAKEIGVPLQPIVIQQRNDNGDGLVRDWPRPDFGRDMNRAYAVQWYALAALAAALGIVFSFRRVRES
jgi:cytochrome oxidase assembly protein ShyY1